jgi:hypothetical protein
MHTLDGKPASFDDSRGAYIHFAGGGRNHPIKLADSLRQIRREQRAAQRENKRNNIPGVEWMPARYGYARVQMPYYTDSRTPAFLL